MKRHHQSGSSIFLMEIIVNILLFAIMLCICLQFFAKAHRLTNTTTALQRAVSTCSGIAALYESGDGTMSPIQQAFTNGVMYDGRIHIYLDDHMLECEASDAVYTIDVQPLLAEDTGTSPLQSVMIQCNQGTEEIYSIQAYHYTQLSPREGGNTP